MTGDRTTQHSGTFNTLFKGVESAIVINWHKNFLNITLFKKKTTKQNLFVLLNRENLKLSWHAFVNRVI